MKIHIVKEGDTLYKLAQKYGVEVEQIVAINPLITHPDELVVGLKVKIPSQPTTVKLALEPHKQAEDLFYEQYIPAEQVGSFYDFPELDEMSGIDSLDSAKLSSEHTHFPTAHFHDLYLPNLKWEYPGGSDDEHGVKHSVKRSEKKSRSQAKKTRAPRGRAVQVQQSKPKKSTPLIKY